MKDKGKLIMLFLIASEAFFFIALIIADVYYRNFTNATDSVADNLDPLAIRPVNALVDNEQFYTHFQ